MPRQRLQKILAQAGLASRRKAEQLITAGRVRVNGRTVTELGASADPRRDRIEVDGKRIVIEPTAYVVLHKPRGVVSTMDDPQGRPTVAELVASVPARLFPVGRLDYATSGVLLMTNDGAFADALLRPRRAVPKTYVVKVSGLMSEADLEQWRAGVELDDGPTLPARVELLRVEEHDRTWLELTLREGRNQQIRRMAEATGLRVMRLARTSFAGIGCADLRPGQWRPLSVDELRTLQKSYGVPQRIRPQRELFAAARRPASPQRGPGSRGAKGSPRSADQTAGPATAARSGRSGRKPRGAGRRASRGTGRGRR